MVEFDDVETDTINTSADSIHQLIEMLGDGQEITAKRLVIKTEAGTLVVDSHAGYDTITVSETDDNEDENE